MSDIFGSIAQISTRAQARTRLDDRRNNMYMLLETPHQ